MQKECKRKRKGIKWVMVGGGRETKEQDARRKSAKIKIIKEFLLRGKMNENKIIMDTLYNKF